MLSDRFRLTIALLSLLAIAGIVHILVVLSVPDNVSHSAYAKLDQFGPDRSFNLLPDVMPGAEPLPALDPAMKHAACRFQLSDGPVAFKADVPVPFWSIGVFNAAGEAIYSLNNRTAGSDDLSMLILSPAQLSILRENPPDDLEDLIVIETDMQAGFALLRAYAPHPSLNALVATALTAAECGSLT
ncbi:putative membrane protein [Roseibium hamelinense]|uniref:Putative membrane protein n=1 Tax=Roseibium hamelinense TaxID=150831 RepID=A0A562TIV7_9HYPH|nr:hypothetical protein [Roseibium hamelinense]MTI42640.1 hypothetical protein [Roseibium hamelinense]TWI93264.1 putative membrane protein [Roseibium hamelinense]